MTKADTLDRAAIARACQRHGARRLQVFGSATTDEFAPGHSDVDFLVHFQDGRGRLFTDYFNLKQELEGITNTTVDLVMVDAIENPYFRQMVYSQAIDVYVA